MDDDIHDPDDEAIERLLELAGPPPKLAPPELTQVESELRHAWRRSVDRAASRRRRLRIAGVVAAAAATAALAVGLGSVFRDRSGGADSGVLATLEVHHGAVEISDAGGALTAGTEVATGTGAHAALRLASGRSLRLDSESAVRLESAAVVTLDHGALYVDSRSPGNAAEGAGVEVLTALGSVREIGTQFEVRLLPAEGGEPGALRVRVREGAVIVLRDGLEQRAEAGSALTLPVHGALERASVAPHGATWEWVERAAAPMAIEGATLTQFLDWAARETGRSWRFASQVPEGAGGIVLHGSIEDVTPGQALEVVLPGCGLRPRFEDRILVIEPAPAAG
jgi:ferric-dicitrate binding protein FerR (iron transport regulator)